MWFDSTHKTLIDFMDNKAIEHAIQFLNSDIHFSGSGAISEAKEIASKLQKIITPTEVKTGVDAATERILQRASASIAKDGYFTISTCDHPNWDMSEHVAMQRLHRNQPPGFHVSYKVSFGVMDWTITNR